MSVFWLVFFGVLIIIEIFTLGLTTIWFAGGALTAFLASLVGASFAIQIILFVVVSCLLLAAVRPYAVKFFNKERTKTNYEGMIGKEGKVIEKISNFNEQGRVMINGLEWTARSETEDEIEVNSKVLIKEISGVKVIVKKM